MGIELFLGAALGTVVGGLLVIPAAVVEWRAHKHEHNLPIIADIAPHPGHRMTHRELFFLALLVHLVNATLFGLIYPIFVEKGWLFVTHSPYTIGSLLVYAVGAWLVVGFILFPALGFGLFGKREGTTVWSEILVFQLLLGVGIWLLIQWFQPVYFGG